MKIPVFPCRAICHVDGRAILSAEVYWRRGRKSFHVFCNIKKSENLTIDFDDITYKPEFRGWYV